MATSSNQRQTMDEKNEVSQATINPKLAADVINN